jgi:glycosyltransferase involved in cell wall biosynthesis
VSYGVVVNSYGRSQKELKAGFDSLLRQANRPSFVLLVDQNQDRRLASLIEPYQALRVQYLASSEKAISAARNNAIDELLIRPELEAEWVLFLDDDAWLADDFSARLADVPMDIDVLGARIVCPDGSLYSHRQIGVKRIAVGRLDLKKVMGGALILRRERLKELRFDPLFGIGAKFPSSEETDFVLRALRAKANVQFDPAIVVHHPPFSVQSLQKAVTYGFGKGALVRKWWFRDSWALLEFVEMTAVPFVRGLSAALTLRPDFAKFHLMTMQSRWKGFFKAAKYEWRD